MVLNRMQNQQDWYCWNHVSGYILYTPFDIYIYIYIHIYSHKFINGLNGWTNDSDTKPAILGIECSWNALMFRIYGHFIERKRIYIYIHPHTQRIIGPSNLGGWWLVTTSHSSCLTWKTSPWFMAISPLKHPKTTRISVMYDVFIPRFACIGITQRQIIMYTDVVWHEYR